MSGEPLNFLDVANDRDRVRFAAMLQLSAEHALWAYEEASSDPGKSEQPLRRLRRVMLQLHGVSQACGHMRVATICHTICMMIEDGAADLMASLLKEIKALRRFVVATLQDDMPARRPQLSLVS